MRLSTPRRTLCISLTATVGDEVLVRLAAGADERLTGAARQAKDMQRAVGAHQRAERALAGCPLCFDGPAVRDSGARGWLCNCAAALVRGAVSSRLCHAFGRLSLGPLLLLQVKKHLILSLGEHSMLMLPPGARKYRDAVTRELLSAAVVKTNLRARYSHRLRLTPRARPHSLPPPTDGARVPGHLILVPLAHVGAMTDAPEEAYDEVNRFKAALNAMYAERRSSSRRRPILARASTLALTSSPWTR